MFKKKVKLKRLFSILFFKLYWKLLSQIKVIQQSLLGIIDQLSKPATNINTFGQFDQ